MKAIKISRIPQRNKVSSQLVQIGISLGMVLLFAASAIGQISWKKYSSYVLSLEPIRKLLEA